MLECEVWYIGGRMPILEEEIETYEDRKEELLGRHEGKFVLVHGGNIVDVFDSKMDAIKDGYERFGNQPFLVKQIVKVETAENFTSNHLGL